MMPQETETLLSQGLGEDIYNLLSRINGLDDDNSITNKSSEMMVLDGNVLCRGSMRISRTSFKSSLKLTFAVGNLVR